MPTLYYNFDCMSTMYSQQQKRCHLSYLSVTLCIHRHGNFKWKNALTSINKRMQKRHTPRIHESMNDMDLLSHNDMRAATSLLLLAVHFFQFVMMGNIFFRPLLW